MSELAAIKRAVHLLAPALAITPHQGEILAAIWAAGEAGLGSDQLGRGNSGAVQLSHLRAKLGEAAATRRRVRIDSAYPDGATYQVGAAKGELGNRGNTRRGARVSLVLVGAAHLLELAARAPWRPPAHWRVGGHKELIAARLVHNWDKATTHAELSTLIRAHGSAGQSPELVRSNITHVRASLSPHGIKVATLGHDGWAFDELARAKLADVRTDYLDHEAGRRRAVSNQGQART